MSRNYDIAIIGGGIIGLATGYYLSQNSDLKIAVIEKKYIGAGSTGRCIAGIRHQFSTPGSIKLMKESVSLFAAMEEEFGFSVEFHQGGYLLLAHNENLAGVFRNNVEIQQREGVNVRLVSPDEIRELFPHVNIDGVLLGAYCPDDAQAFPFAVLKGYKKGITRNGGDFIIGNGVKELKKDKNFVIRLDDGEVIEAAKVVLAAGPWTGELGSQVGLDLPLFPERHEALITERMPKFLDPMVVDYRTDGCYFQQLVTGQVIGCYSPYPVVPGIREDVSFEFMPQLAWRMSRLVPALKNASVLRQWSGSYTMTPDGNPIMGESEVENLYIGSGMCGHGFMFGPAMGKNLANYIEQGDWLMDFSEFAIDRDFKSSKETLK